MIFETHAHYDDKMFNEDRESLLEHLEGYVQDGDTILVKASHFMKFEEVVTKLENM